MSYQGGKAKLGKKIYNVISKLELYLNPEEKLDYFIKQKKIPNIIFHGVSGSGKNKLVNNFINQL